MSTMAYFLNPSTGTNNVFESPIKETNHQLYGKHFQQEPLVVLNNNMNAIDEIDNRTSDQPEFFSKFVMDDIYRFEVERLKTFEDWPLDFIDKHVLAQTGMFYTGESDKVKCYFCETEIGRWEESDHPVGEHIKWSTNCPLLRRRTTNNIPINTEALNRVLPPASYDICGSNDLTEVRPTAYPEGTISSSATNSGPSSPQNYQMDYPQYAIEAVRFRSFAEWPRNMKQGTKELAEAGFFYTGVGDRVNCFSCGGGLKDWDENDEPWEQHAQWFSKCRYLKLIKGQAFIDSVIAKFNQAVEKNQEALNAAANESENNNKQTSSSATTGAPMSSLDKKNLLQRSDSYNSDKRIIPEEKLCKICYAAEYNTAFLPCGHVVACAKCASAVIKCPMCRKPFKDVMRVYFS